MREMKQYSKTIRTNFEFIDNFRSTNTDEERYKLVLDEINDYCIEDDSNTVERLLINYDFATGSIQNVNIVDGWISKEGNGKLYVEFEVYYHFGCDDINRTEEHEMEIKVRVDFRNGEITITGEEQQERLPDEY